jgi:hypothetical protein
MMLAPAATTLDSYGQPYAESPTDGVWRFVPTAPTYVPMLTPDAPLIQLTETRPPIVSRPLTPAPVAVTPASTIAAPKTVPLVQSSSAPAFNPGTAQPPQFDAPAPGLSRGQWIALAAAGAIILLLAVKL